MHAHTGIAEQQAIKVIGTYHLSELANWADQCKKWNVSIRSNFCQTYQPSKVGQFA